MTRLRPHGTPDGIAAGGSHLALAAALPNTRDRRKADPDRPPSTRHHICLDVEPEYCVTMNAAARAAYERQLEDVVDPQRQLDRDDPAQCVAYLRRARLAQISLNGVEAPKPKAIEQRRAQEQAQTDPEPDAIIAAEQAAA